jgi:hypothetical protein
LFCVCVCFALERREFESVTLRLGSHYSCRRNFSCTCFQVQIDVLQYFLSLGKIPIAWFSLSVCPATVLNYCLLCYPWTDPFFRLLSSSSHWVRTQDLEKDQPNHYYIYWA